MMENSRNEFLVATTEGKLTQSSAANETLGSQLETIEPQLGNLEASLEVTKKKLKEESRLRRQAELAQVEVEARYKESEATMFSLRDENESLRTECNALHEELTFKCRELEDSTNEQKVRRKLLGNRMGSSDQKREERNGESSIRSDSAMELSHCDTETVSNRSNNRTKGDPTVDDSYAEVLDELETVTEQLIATQKKLWTTEDNLRSSDARVRKLEAYRKDKRRPGKKLRSLVDDDQGEDDSHSEAEFRDELSVLKDELSLAHGELRAATEQAESYQARLTTLEKSKAIREDGAKLAGIENQKSKIEDLKEQVRELEDSARSTQQELVEKEDILAESREENAGLVEEIACLRETLLDQTDQDSDKLDTVSGETKQSEIELREEIEKTVRASVLQEANKEREREINLLREKFKKIFKENAALQQRIDNFESGAPQPLTRKQDVSRFKEEIARLETALKRAQDQHRSVLLESEASWRKKLEREFPSSENQKEIIEARTLEVKSLQDQVKALKDQKDDMEDKVHDIEKSLKRAQHENEKNVQHVRVSETNLKASRDEMLKLRKRIGSLTSELEHSNKVIARLDFEGENLRQQCAEVKAKLEVSQEVIEESGLEDETINREDSKQQKQKIHALSASLDKVRTDYTELVSELEHCRQRFFDSQEDTSRKSEDEIAHLTKQIADLEDEFETYRNEQVDLFKELELAKRKCGKARKEGEKLGRESAEQELKAHQIEERKVVMNKFEDMAGLKFSLESQLEDYGAKLATIQIELEDAKAAIAPVRQELNECQAALSTSRIEYLELKEELGDPPQKRESRERGMEVINRLFGQTYQMARESRDPDPISHVEEGLELTDLIQKEPAQVLRSYTRDPPTSRSQLLASSVVKSEEDDNNIGQLRSRLRDVSLENEMLKRKILSLSNRSNAASDYESEENKAHYSKEISKLKDQVNALQICLQSADQGSVELEKLQSKLDEAESKLQKKEAEVKTSQEALKHSNDHHEALMAEISSLNESLKRSRVKISSVKEELEDATRQSVELQKEIKLKNNESAEKVRTMMVNARGDEFADIRDQFKKLTEQKGSLQSQFDDSKIALSVSQYAQERNKEELRACEAKLSASMDEAYRQQKELSRRDQTLSDLKLSFDEVLGELSAAREISRVENDSRKEATTLTKQLTTLAEDNAGLQQMVDELEEALSISQEAIDKKSEEIRTLKNSSVSTQEETRMLTEELSHLSSAFETAKSEYDAVVDELEAVNELFDEARQEAERSGRDAAAEEIRSEMHAAREKERKLMKDQVRKVFEENAALQRKLDGAEVSLSEARNDQKRSKEFSLLQKEVDVLREALKFSAEEVKKLREKEFNLALTLNETKKELAQAQDDFELATQALDDARHAAESTARATSTVEFRSDTESHEGQMLRDHLKRLINENEGSTLKAIASDSDSGHKAAGLRLKVELLDMSMSLEKVMKENAVLEGELERVRKNVDTVRTESEKQGKMNATKEIRAEMKLEREREMKEFKDQFNSLVYENANLEQKLKDVEIALTVAKDSRDRSREELDKLESEMRASRVETRRFQEEVFNLTVELETANDDHERVVDGIRSKLKAERDAKLKTMKHQLSALTIDNSALQHKLRSAGVALATTQSSEGRTKDEIESLHHSLHRAQDVALEFEDDICMLKSELDDMKRENNNVSAERSALQQKLKQAEAALLIVKSSRVVSDKDAEELNSHLYYSQEESLELRSKVAQLSRSLEQSTKDLDQLREKFDKTCNEAEQRGREAASTEFQEKRNSAQSNSHNVLRSQLENLVEEKAALQQEVDEARISLSLSKYLQDRNKEELKICQEELQSSRESAVKEVDLTALNSELAKAKEEHSSTIDTLGNINKILDTIEAMSVDKEIIESDDETDKVTNIYKFNGFCRKCLEDIGSLDEKIKGANTTLVAARDVERCQENVLKTYKASLTSVTETAEITMHKVSALASILKKSKKQHSDALAELQAVKNEAEVARTTLNSTPRDGLEREIRQRLLAEKETEMKTLRDQTKAFFKENAELEKKVEDAEEEVIAAWESQQKQKMELELCELKHEEARREASRFKTEVSRLQSALGDAHEDHISLRKQMETINTRVAQLCNEAEERGKAVANEELRMGFKSLKDNERKELMSQFKNFYEENLTLQEKLDETSAALAIARDAEGKQKAELKKIENCENCEKAEAKANELETVNKRLSSELETLKRNLEEAKSNRDIVVRELDLVKQRLAEVRGVAMIREKEIATNDAQTVTSEHLSEHRLLQDQFKKLSAQSVALGRKVVDAENAVAVVREEQEKHKGESMAKAKSAKSLHAKVEKAVDRTKKRDQEIAELAVMMESKVSMTEENVNKLEHDISVAKGALQVSQAGLVIVKRQRAKEPPTPRQFAGQVAKTPGPPNPTLLLGDDISEPSLEQSRSESRDDSGASSALSMKRIRARSISPAVQEVSREDDMLSSLALEAIARGKKKAQLRRFDFRHAQRKISGNDEKVAARTSPFAKRPMLKPMKSKPEEKAGDDLKQSEVEPETQILLLNGRESGPDGRE
jgi:chromosome segregation ATPase